MEQLVKEEAQKHLKKQIQEARIQRQKQVRQQAIAWTEATRKKFEETKEKEIKGLASTVTGQVQNAAIQNIEHLTKLNDLAMAEIGMAHRAAAGYQNVEKLKSLKRLKNEEVAKNRGTAAMMRHVKQKEAERSSSTAILRRKEAVRKAEDELSKDLVSRRPLKLSNAGNETKPKLGPPEYQQSIAKTLKVANTGATGTKSARPSANATMKNKTGVQAKVHKDVQIQRTSSSYLELKSKKKQVSTESVLKKMVRIKTTSPENAGLDFNSEIVQEEYSTLQDLYGVGYNLRGKYQAVIKGSPLHIPAPIQSKVRYFDSTIPKGEVKYIAPEGLAVKETRTSPDAWEKGRKSSKQSIQEQRSKVLKEEEITQKAVERGRKAMKKAKLEKEIIEVRNELLEEIELNLLGTGSQKAILGLDEEDDKDPIDEIHFVYHNESSDEFSAVNSDEELEFSSPPRTTLKTYGVLHDKPNAARVSLKELDKTAASTTTPTSDKSSSVTDYYSPSPSDEPVTPTADEKIPLKSSQQISGTDKSMEHSIKGASKAKQSFDKNLDRRPESIEKLPLSSSSTSTVGRDSDIMGSETFASAGTTDKKHRQSTIRRGRTSSVVKQVSSNDSGSTIAETAVVVGEISADKSANSNVKKSSKHKKQKPYSSMENFTTPEDFAVNETRASSNTIEEGRKPAEKSAKLPISSRKTSSNSSGSSSGNQDLSTSHEKRVDDTDSGSTILEIVAGTIAGKKSTVSKTNKSSQPRKSYSFIQKEEEKHAAPEDLTGTKEIGSNSDVFEKRKKTSAKYSQSEEKVPSHKKDSSFSRSSNNKGPSSSTLFEKRVDENDSGSTILEFNAGRIVADKSTTSKINKTNQSETWNSSDSSIPKDKVKQTAREGLAIKNTRHSSDAWETGEQSSKESIQEQRNKAVKEDKITQKHVKKESGGKTMKKAKSKKETVEKRTQTSDFKLQKTISGQKGKDETRTNEINTFDHNQSSDEFSAVHSDEEFDFSNPPLTTSDVLQDQPDDTILTIKKRSSLHGPVARKIKQSQHSQHGTDETELSSQPDSSADQTSALVNIKIKQTNDSTRSDSSETPTSSSNNRSSEESSALLNLKVLEDTATTSTPSSNESASATTDYYSPPDGPFTSTPDGKLHPKSLLHRLSYNDSMDRVKRRTFKHYLDKFLNRRPESIEKLPVSTSSTSLVRVDSNVIDSETFALADTTDGNEETHSKHGHSTTRSHRTSSGSSRSSSNSNSKGLSTLYEEQVGDVDSGSTIAETAVLAGRIANSDSSTSANTHSSPESSLPSHKSSSSSGAEPTSSDSLTGLLRVLSNHQEIERQQLNYDEKDQSQNYTSVMSSQHTSGNNQSALLNSSQGSIPDASLILRRLVNRQEMRNSDSSRSSLSSSPKSGPEKETKRVELLSDVTPTKLWESPSQIAKTGTNDTEKLAAVFENLIDKWSNMRIEKPPWTPYTGSNEMDANE